jgi:hypothetical protein
MKNRSFKHDNSGQVLVVTALLVALLLLSTALYVIDLEKKTPIAQASETDFSEYKASIRNTLISGLVNTTNGGDPEILTADLQALKDAITAHSYQNLVGLDFANVSAAPYHNGIWVSWGNSGHGISSAYASLVFVSSASSASSELEYTANVTSEIYVQGSYSMLEGTAKQVNLTVQVQNEGKPALAGNFTLYFEFDGSTSSEDWVQVDSPGAVDFGNGTYSFSFIADTNMPSDPVLVSVHCQDLRGVLVNANATCTRVG